ncbi:hypothetical protein NP493_981g02005 [Ridgeia piscesae]|uniref:ABC transporter domain-containing protein n=1 Tax=Ridgeia piscesae TaxID=27915 RepID=A0AAD9NM24_RIDPI|nr:hypothetical protein NP493_981g02005 [Ridgeia piscesae]
MVTCVCVTEIVPPDEWPAKGEVTFESVSLSYDATLEPVVTDFNLHVHGGETIGLCGRTGSGKSSVTLSLFRINHICAGRILIDGLDISCISLHTLRSRLTVIPQDPVLFSGTLRFNLDTEGSSDDSAIWRVLEIVQMKAGVLDLPEKLDFVVTEGGENFSVGERQLLCIARAIMRDSRLLIMDEATASVDLRTDQVIQEVLRTQFTHSTVVIIAHRVSSILTCDKVVVLSAGKVLEVDTPYHLRMRDSVFASMVNQID